MELMALVFVWPFLLLVVGLVFVSAVDVFSFGMFGFWGVLLLILLAWIFNKRTNQAERKDLSMFEQLDELRGAVIVFSIALLLPIFIQYLIASLKESLAVILVSLIFGFGVVLWGMFIKDRKIFSYSNILGGALVVGYTYMQIWQLGEGARIIATAFGLIVAVSVAVIKLKDKLA